MDYMPIVVSAKYIDGYKIEVTFDNGEKRVVNCEQWLHDGIFEPLREEDKFKEFFVDGWTISWPNGADIAPETLYNQPEK